MTSTRMISDIESKSRYMKAFILMKDTLETSNELNSVLTEEKRYLISSIKSMSSFNFFSPNPSLEFSSESIHKKMIDYIINGMHQK